MNPADALIEIIDASRRPVKWLSLYSFIEKFDCEAAFRCRIMGCKLIYRGQRYGVIDLTDSPVTPWMGFRLRESRWVETCNAAADLIDGYLVRLGDGTPERKEDDGPHADRN